MRIQVGTSVIGSATLAMLAFVPVHAQSLDALIGTWTSRQVVSVRSRSATGKYEFRRDTVALQLVVAPDGTVRGTIGGAALMDGTLRRNRTWIGRALHVKTDYVIKGRLVGPVIPSDTIAEKKISAPFNLKNGATTGSLFHLVGWDLYPMSGFELTRVP
jgi:hypothetical protein